MFWATFWGDVSGRGLRRGAGLGEGPVAFGAAAEVASTGAREQVPGAGVWQGQDGEILVANKLRGGVVDHEHQQAMSLHAMDHGAMVELGDRAGGGAGGEDGFEQGVERHGMPAGRRNMD